MFDIATKKRLTFLAAAAAMVFAGACAQSLPTTPSTQGGSLLSSTRPAQPGPTLRFPDIEYFEVCKDYAGGTGPDVTFTVAVDIGNNGATDQTFQTTLSAGECEDVWLHGGTTYDRVTVTETVPAGYAASFVTSVVVGTTVTTQPVAAGNVASGSVRGDTGYLVVFTNTPAPPPPPPPGLQGCTPGYWKQEHHFDSWTAPYAPTTLFSAVFENAFPGLTLLDVLNLNGGPGGLNQLGRQTVAALLNTASGNVSYGLTPGDVIAAFNGVFPGGNYEALKNQFDVANNRGCPLN